MEFKLILPEIILIIIAMIGQMMGVFVRKQRIANDFYIFSCLLLIWYIFYYHNHHDSGFHESFVSSRKINIIKILILGFAVMAIVLYKNFCKITNYQIKAEFSTLLLLSVAGIFISISSRNLLLLFCGLELIALPSYALTAFNMASTKSSEAGLKYFITGALLSAIGSFGISFIYGFSGSLDFSAIRIALSDHPNIGLIIGLLLFLANIFFKLSTAPLHFWTPDVYEGAPLPVVSYFATAAKFGSLVILINLLSIIIGDYKSIATELVKILAILSMIIGALGALKQRSLKRLMAYGTILNIGYTLLAVSLNTEQAYKAAMINMFIYAVSIMGFFALLIGLLGARSDDANFDYIKGAASSRKAIAGAIMIIMFSMIGIPPFAGFFGKYYIFYEAVKLQEYMLVLVGIITSVISSYYYLKVVNALYFAEQENEIERIPTQSGLLVISVLTLGFILLFSLIII